MYLQLISLKGVEFEGDIVSLNLKTTAGEITILDNHRPIITELISGKAIIIDKKGERKNFNILSGFLEVGRNNQVVLLMG